MFKYLVLLLTVLASLDAKVSLQEINSKPTSRAKDFIIWQYLNQSDTSALDAKKAYKQIETLNDKLLFSYAKITDDASIKKEASCKQERDLLSIKDKKCLTLALEPQKVLALSKKDKLKLRKKISSKKYRGLIVISTQKDISKVYKRYRSDTFLTFFNNVSAVYRANKLNISISKKYLNAISVNKKFLKFIQIVLEDDKLNKVQKSLLNVKTKHLSSQGAFLLALNQLKYSKVKKATKFLKYSLSKAKKQTQKDKINFWLYMISKKKIYLKKLLKSSEINIYTLYASELMYQPRQNYFTSLNSKGINNKFNLSNPFDVKKIISEIKSTPKNKLFTLADKYSQDNMLAIQALILEKAYNYKKHIYLMPYNDYLKDVSNDEKAMIYALMKQESQFIPSAISTSYALGLMQIMPFVTNIISEKIDSPVKSYNEMFIPKNNIRYAIEHIRWIKKNLNHPIFIAYSYNGGLGFFKRHLQKGKFQKKEFEPYLSLELMQNDQAREYGKKVLANYVIYKKILKDDVSISSLFDTLTQQKSKEGFQE